MWERLKRRLLKKEYETLEAMIRESDDKWTKASEMESRASATMNKAQYYLKATAIARDLETCATKIEYGTEEAARYAAIAIYAKYNRILEPYKCPCCPGFHLTKADRTPSWLKKELSEMRNGSIPKAKMAETASIRQSVTTS